MGDKTNNQIEEYIEVANRWHEWTNKTMYEDGGFDTVDKVDDERTERLEQQDREWQTCLSEWAKRLAPLLPHDLATKLFKLAAMSCFGDGKDDVHWPDIRAELQALAMREGNETIELSELVTLDQVAPLAGLSKRTLEKHLTDGVLPKPDIQGGGGKAHKWYWHKLRLSHGKVSKKVLPEKFPGSKFVTEN